MHNDNDVGYNFYKTIEILKEKQKILKTKYRSLNRRGGNDFQKKRTF